MSIVEMCHEADKDFRFISGQHNKFLAQPIVSEILSHGRSAAKEILKAMDGGFARGALLLQEIYGINPVPESARGSHTHVLLCWKTFVDVAEGQNPR